MAISVGDYLIDQSTIDWDKALASWAWLLPPEFTVWFVNRFADLIIAMPDGSIHLLDVGAGSLTKIADSREDFLSRIDEGDNADNWFLIPLVDRMVTAGKTLAPGQCYGWYRLPIMGGEYKVENAAPLAIDDYLGAYGSVHEQTRDLPDGARVKIEVID